MTYAGTEFWDKFHSRRRECGDDLDWEGLWTEPFVVPLREAGVRTVLELGCGTGNDAARPAAAGYSAVSDGCPKVAVMPGDRANDSRSPTLSS